MICNHGVQTGAIVSDDNQIILDRSLKYMQLVGAFIAILVPVLLVISWWAGGIRLGSEVASAAVTHQLDVLQFDVNAIRTSIGGLPLSTQRMADQDIHLSHIDAFLTSLESRLTADELMEARNDARIEALVGKEGVFRQPRNP